MVRKKQFERIMQYIVDEYDVSPEYLWTRYPDFAVFRHPNSNKWFGLIMNVPAHQLGQPGDDAIRCINLHLEPRLVATLIDDAHFIPGYHMNKNSWVTIFLNDGLTDNQIKPLIRASYDSVAPVRIRRA